MNKNVRKVQQQSRHTITYQTEIHRQRVIETGHIGMSWTETVQIGLGTMQCQRERETQDNIRTSIKEYKNGV